MNLVNKIILPNEQYIFFNIGEPLMKDSPEYDAGFFDEYRKLLNYK
jgi:hypothetical protein